MSRHLVRSADRAKHEARVKAWGDKPVILKMDILLCEIIRQLGFDAQHLANEIACKRRDLGAYEFASRRTLATFDTRHESLESLPWRFPPLRLEVGKVLSPHVGIQRLLPAGDLSVNYNSNQNTALYVVRHDRLPETVLSSFPGQPVSQIVQGVPDERKIHLARNGREAGRAVIHLTVTPAFQEYTSKPQYEEEKVEIHSGPIAFRGRELQDLRHVLDCTPNAGGRRIYKRREISIVPLRITTPGEKGRIYLAILPRDQSAVPNLALHHSGWDKRLGCYLADASEVDAAELSANLHAAKARSLYCPKLIKDMQAWIGKPFAHAAA